MDDKTAWERIKALQKEKKDLEKIQDRMAVTIVTLENKIISLKNENRQLFEDRDPALTIAIRSQK